MSGAENWRTIFADLNDRSVSVRQKAAQSLRMVPDDSATVEQLTEELLHGLKDKNKYVRIAMATALVRCSLDHSKGLTTLTDLLQDPHRDICIAAAVSLKSLKQLAGDALPVLEATLPNASDAAKPHLRQAIDTISAAMD